jgi:hypothetical protein
VDDLLYSIGDTGFDASLSKSIDEIYHASVANVLTDLPAGIV